MLYVKKEVASQSLGLTPTPKRNSGFLNVWNCAPLSYRFLRIETHSEEVGKNRAKIEA